MMLFLTVFFFNNPPTTQIYTLSLHDALPISEHSCERIEIDLRSAMHSSRPVSRCQPCGAQLPQSPLRGLQRYVQRSEEHTSELQSQFHLVCRLLLEKKKIHDRRSDRRVFQWR